MKNRASLALISLLFALLVTACGGGGGKASLGGGDVLVVGGQHVTKDDLNVMMTRARKSYETNKQKFPKPGTQEFSDQYQATHVWIKQQGRWQLVAAHVSQLKK